MIRGRPPRKPGRPVIQVQTLEGIAPASWGPRWPQFPETEKHGWHVDGKLQGFTSDLPVASDAANIAELPVSPRAYGSTVSEDQKPCSELAVGQLLILDLCTSVRQTAQAGFETPTPDRLLRREGGKRRDDEQNPTVALMRQTAGGALRSHGACLDARMGKTSKAHIEVKERVCRRPGNFGVVFSPRTPLFPVAPLPGGRSAP